MYRRLLDRYYGTGKPLVGDAKAIARLIRMNDQLEAVEVVLAEFFIKTETGWRHEVCDENIIKMRNGIERRRENGKNGGRPSGSKDSAPRKSRKQVVDGGNESSENGSIKPNNNQQLSGSEPNTKPNKKLPAPEQKASHEPLVISHIHSVSDETGADAPRPTIAPPALAQPAEVVVASAVVELPSGAATPVVPPAPQPVLPASGELWGDAPPPAEQSMTDDEGRQWERDFTPSLSDLPELPAEYVERLRTGEPPPMTATPRGFEPPAGPFDDIAAEIWAVGKALMAYYPAKPGPRGGRKDPGQMIGKWLRDARDPKIVLDAVWAAISAGTHEPIPFIQRIVDDANHGRGLKGNTYSGSLKGMDYRAPTNHGDQSDWADAYEQDQQRGGHSS